MRDKVALFDFCETLVDFQTADAFVDYVRLQTGNRRMLILDSIQRILRRLRIIGVVERITPGHSLNKRLKLLQLKGQDYHTLLSFAESYYNHCIKPHFISPIINELLSLQREGYLVGLVSGGYGIYLDFFVKDFSLDFCISTDIQFKNDVCTGKFDGIDCLNENKIILLNHKFRKKPVETVAYSDSESDLPLLLWVKKGVVVSHGLSQKWSVNNNLKEIIWN